MAFLNQDLVHSLFYSINLVFFISKLMILIKEGFKRKIAENSTMGAYNLADLSAVYEASDLEKAGSGGCGACGQFVRF